MEDSQVKDIIQYEGKTDVAFRADNGESKGEIGIRMKQMTVCFLLKNTPEREVLLGLKNIGFGAGKYTGIGGKVEPGETVEIMAIREVEKGIGVIIIAEDVRFVGQVMFLFPYRN